MSEFTIGEIAKQAQVETSTLRYYESVGLLPPPKRVSGQRRYEPAILKRLAFIKLAQQAGFSVSEMLTLLAGFEKETPPLSHWQILAKQKLSELEAKIQRAQTMKQLLEVGLKCGCLSFDDCWAILNQPN
jgi:MerR family transcriptional regulator, redox-sensitive transcriptional activator SoxR